MSVPVFLAITLSGWVLTGSYLLYEYNDYGIEFFNHLFSYDDFVTSAFHFFILATPFVTTAFGYFYRERTNLLKGIRELETRYRDYYDNAPCGYHSCSDDLTFIDVNDSWLRMLGYQRDEVVGKMRLTDLLTPEGRAVIDDVHRFFMESGNVEHLQFDFIRKDGQPLPVVLSATALYDEKGGFLRSRTIVKDNTERKNYEAALRAVSEEWQGTFDSMPWGVLLMDDCRSLIRANEYITSLPDISAEDLMSTRCCILIDEMREAPGANGALNSTRMQEFHEDRSDRYYRLYGRPITVNGSVRSYVFALVDVTDIKQGEKTPLTTS
jgi:PAS domain S-box-containing protein